MQREEVRFGTVATAARCPGAMPAATESMSLVIIRWQGEYAQSDWRPAGWAIGKLARVAVVAAHTEGGVAIGPVQCDQQRR